MSTELTVLNNTAVQNYESPDTDNGNWGDDDEASKPQFVSMKQALTEGMDHIPNGTFFCRASGQTWDKINMVVLRMGKTRQWKPSSPKFVADEKPLCKSRNGKVPIMDDDRLVPQAKSCDACPKSSWAGYDRKTKTGDKPTCDKGFQFLFLDEETNLPYIYDASGQGVEPSEAVYEAIRQRAKVVKGKTGRMPNTWEFSVEMVSEKGNKAFKPKFTTVRQMKFEEALAKYGPLYQQFVVNYNNRPKPATEEVQDAEYVDVPDTGAVDEDDEVVAA